LSVAATLSTSSSTPTRVVTDEDELLAASGDVVDDVTPSFLWCDATATASFLWCDAPATPESLVSLSFVVLGASEDCKLQLLELPVGCEWNEAEFDGGA